MRLTKVDRKQDLKDSARDFHDHNLTGFDDLHRILFEAIDLVEDTNIPYGVIGGLAVKNLGRPRVTHDVDFFVKPDDADRLLKAFEAKGFETYKRDPVWLYKAWKDEILVDIIFRSSGDIYFDEEMMTHVRRVPYMGRLINAVSPEDFIVIKAAAHQEHNPHHWHDALAVLTQGNIDWSYFLNRARHSPRRVLALLIYGQSNDIAIPSEVIQKLYRTLYEPPVYNSNAVHRPYSLRNPKDLMVKPSMDSPVYVRGRIIDALTKDERIAEHDIQIHVAEDTVIIKGEVFSEDQKTAVIEVVAKHAPEFTLKNHVTVRILNPPEESEAIQ